MDNKFGKDLSLNEFLSKTGYKRSSFYDRLDDMYGEKGAYKIPQYKFKKIGRKLGEREDQKKGDNDFLFKKEWADLAVVLTRMYKNNPMYSKASSYKKMNLDKFQAFNAYCLNEIENLNDNHKNEVKTHPIYGAMIMEKIMLERVQEQMNVLFRYLSDSSIEQRTIVFQHLDISISQLLLECFVIGENTKSTIKHDANEFQKFFLGDFMYTFMDLFIAELLAKEVDEEFINEKREFIENYAEKNIETTSISMEQYIEKREKQAIEIAMNTPTFDLLLEGYVAKYNLSDSQKVVLYDFAKQLEEYRLEYGKQVSECKETVSHVFSVMNAEILRRN
ncbi:hypothetical protein PNU51_14005 [Turicibacter sanguinis]|uniref:hypothetical protein n=1 Tax=Turicibacter sanguinis TaxID=154288 RepID=UPI00232B0468|nr:hypothetical protein [Turicibacter sanguinis]MDB8562402.1 hypothetical protein [Turicibacter sanguinis]